MKHILCLTVFLIFANLHSFSQDSTIIINKGRLLKYRWGYLITSKDDTVYGLIYHESDSKIYFIKGNTFLHQSALFYTINLFLKRASQLLGLIQINAIRK